MAGVASAVSFGAMIAAMGPLTASAESDAGGGNDGAIDEASAEPAGGAVVPTPPEVIVEVVPRYVPVDAAGSPITTDPAAALSADEAAFLAAAGLTPEAAGLVAPGAMSADEAAFLAAAGLGAPAPGSSAAPVATSGPSPSGSLGTPVAAQGGSTSPSPTPPTGAAGQPRPAAPAPTAATPTPTPAPTPAPAASPPPPAPAPTAAPAPPRSGASG